MASSRRRIAPASSAHAPPNGEQHDASTPRYQTRKRQQKTSVEPTISTPSSPTYRNAPQQQQHIDLTNEPSEDSSSDPDADDSAVSGRTKTYTYRRGAPLRFADTVMGDTADVDMIDRDEAGEDEDEIENEREREEEVDGHREVGIEDAGGTSSAKHLEVDDDDENVPPQRRKPATYAGGQDNDSDSDHDDNRQHGAHAGEHADDNDHEDSEGAQRNAGKGKKPIAAKDKHQARTPPALTPEQRERAQKTLKYFLRGFRDEESVDLMITLLNLEPDTPWTPAVLAGVRKMFFYLLPDNPPAQDQLQEHTANSRQDSNGQNTVQGPTKGKPPQRSVSTKGAAFWLPIIKLETIPPLDPAFAELLLGPPSQFFDDMYLPHLMASEGTHSLLFASDVKHMLRLTKRQKQDWLRIVMVMIYFYIITGRKPEDWSTFEDRAEGKRTKKLLEKDYQRLYADFVEPDRESRQIPQTPSRRTAATAASALQTPPDSRATPIPNPDFRPSQHLQPAPPTRLSYIDFKRHLDTWRDTGAQYAYFIPRWGFGCIPLLYTHLPHKGVQLHLTRAEKPGGRQWHAEASQRLDELGMGEQAAQASESLAGVMEWMVGRYLNGRNTGLREKAPGK